MNRSRTPRAVGRCVVGVIVASVAAFETTPNASANTQQLTLSASTVDSGTTFGLLTDAPLYCAGDAERGYRWATFITPAGNDPSTITYRLGQPRGAAFTDALTDTASMAISNRDPGFGDGFVSPPTNIRLSSPRYGSLTAGEYRLGVACVRRGADNVYRVTRHWDLPVTVEKVAGAGPNGFVLRGVGAPPATAVTGVENSKSSDTVTTDAAPTTTSVASADSAPAPADTEPNSDVLAVADSVAATSELPRSGTRAGWWLLWIAVSALLVRIGYVGVARLRDRRGGGS